MGNWKYFTDEEVAGLKGNLPGMLDKARGLMDTRIAKPAIILAFTTGGQHCGHSAHGIGAAVDIGLGHLAEGFERDQYRWALIKALYDAGFERIENCPLHVHVDIGQEIQPDGTYVAPTHWLGKDS